MVPYSIDGTESYCRSELTQEKLILVILVILVNMGASRMPKTTLKGKPFRPEMVMKSLKRLQAKAKYRASKAALQEQRESKRSSASDEQSFCRNEDVRER